MQVQTLKLHDSQYPTPASAHHLAEALCSMPKLIDLTLDLILTEEFISVLKAKASSIKVKTLKLEHIQYSLSPASAHHLAEALCSMPNLIDLTLDLILNEEFYSGLKAKALSIQVQTLKLEHIQNSLSPVLSHHLVEALCCMPNLTALILEMYFTKEFYSVLKAKASSIQVQTLKLHDYRYPTPASAHHLAEALCSMPNLIDLTLDLILNEEFYSGLKAKALSIRVQTLKLEHIQYSLTPVSSHHLVGALCSMPNLTDLTLRMSFTEEFYSVLKAKASSIQVQTLKLHQVQRPSPASSHHLVEALCSMPHLTDLTLEMYLTEEFYSVLKAKASSIQLRKINFRFNGIAHDLDSFLLALTRLQRSADLSSSNVTLPLSDHPQQQSMGDVHSPRRTLPPPDHPQQQTIGGVHCRRRTLPPSDHPEIPEKQAK